MSRYRYLGMVVDSTLWWKAQSIFLLNKLRSISHFLYHLSGSVSRVYLEDFMARFLRLHSGRPLISANGAGQLLFAGGTGGCAEKGSWNSGRTSV